MTFDPYVCLGVSRTASPEAIKAAYRRRARETHPDVSRSHDAGPFQEVVRAFDILSDAKRRQQFDETGVVDEVDQIKERMEAVQVLSGLFGKMIDDATKHNVDLDSLDIIEALTAVLKRNILDATVQLSGITLHIEERLRLRKRITRLNDGPNLFADQITEQIDELTKDQSEQQHRLRLLRLAETEVGNYRSEVELISAFQSMSFGWARAGGDDSGWSVTRTSTT